MKKSLIFVIVFYASHFQSISQEYNNGNYPEIGKPMLNFSLSDIKYFKRRNADLDYFKGKWLVLDFWNKHCFGCIASFPKTNEIQKRYADKIQFLLIAMEGYEVDKENEIRSIYNRYVKAEKLILPCAFDSVLWKHFDIASCPHLIIVDDKGIVRGITNEITTEDVQALLKGESPILPTTYRYAHEPKSEDSRIPYDSEKPFLINGNGGKDTDFIFRSLLAKFDPNVNHFSAPDEIDDITVKKGEIDLLGLPLYRLYNYAFYGMFGWQYNDSARYGKYYSRAILEMKDSSIFKYSFYTKSPKNVFSYSLNVPTSRASRDLIEKAIQRDLETYFGFTAKIEIRKCPCWKLIASKEAGVKLKSMGEPKVCKFISGAGFFVKDYPIKIIIDAIANAQDKDNSPFIIYDETGIRDPIDIDLSDCFFQDLNSIKMSLRKNGLDLVEEYRNMSVLVIRDGILE